MSFKFLTILWFREAIQDGAYASDFIPHLENCPVPFSNFEYHERKKIEKDLENENFVFPVYRSTNPTTRKSAKSGQKIRQKFHVWSVW